MEFLDILYYVMIVSTSLFSILISVGIIGMGAANTNLWILIFGLLSTPFSISYFIWTLFSLRNLT